MSDPKIIDWKARTESAEAERDALKARLEKLTSDIRILIDESSGVYGLHMNGDPAPWGDLLSGGRFEEWLGSLDEEAS